MKGLNLWAVNPDTVFRQPTIVDAPAHADKPPFPTVAVIVGVVALAATIFAVKHFEKN